MITAEQADEFFTAFSTMIAALRSPPQRVFEVEEMEYLQHTILELYEEFHNEYWHIAEEVARSKRM